MFHVPEKFRLRLPPGHPLYSTAAQGNNGAFLVPAPRHQELRVVASDGGEWEHVSVSRRDRTPTWDEMALVKDLFWDNDDCVVQYHPPKSDYINNHPYCLHLWRPIGIELPRPPAWMVGIRDMSQADTQEWARRMNANRLE